MTDPTVVTLIGFGEAGAAFADGWPGTARVHAFDLKTEDPATLAAMRARFDRHGVRGHRTRAEALEGVDTVVCLVTADAARDAAVACAPHLAPGTLWLDGNSCAPGTKRGAAGAVEKAGGRYLDMAIMSPVRPKGHRAPVLLSGPDAEEGAARLRALDMLPEVVGPEVGQASAIKMLRSVMIKGLEALTAECLLGARRAGVEERVLASLAGSDPEIDWAGRAAYNLERMGAHGTRRAAEMREVVATLAEMALPGAMAAATVEWQAKVGGLGLTVEEGEPLAARLDRVLSRL